MPTSAARTRPGRLARALALAVLVGSLAACSGGGPDESPAPAPTTGVPGDVALQLQRVLDRRASAVRRGDAAAFGSGLAPGRPRFESAQRTYFANLAQLPLARFRYTLDRGSLVRDGDDYWVVVRLTMELDGYDDHPVTTPDRFRFTPSARGRFVLASVTDAAWEARHRVAAQPWETGPVEVRTGAGVLGIFDAVSVAHADGIVSSVEDGIAAVSAVVPYPWRRSVVVYALSDSAFLATIDDLPGGDPEQLDGVAFPVRSTADGGRVAATRFVLSPRMLDRPGVERDRLIRHELTHVAVGERDDEAPVWLSEGLAEYVSVRPLAPQDRLISEDALAAAERGVDELPDDARFNDADSRAHYAISWWACEFVADHYGQATLWTLLDDLAQPGTDPGQVLRTDLGIDSVELAHRAARLIVETFDPESLPPSESPGPTPG